MRYSVYDPGSRTYRIYEGPNFYNRSSMGAYSCSALGADPAEVQDVLPPNSKSIGQKGTPEGKIVIASTPTFLSFVLSVCAIVTANLIFNKIFKR